MSVPENLRCQVDHSITKTTCSNEADFVLRFDPPPCGCAVNPEDDFDFKTVRRLCLLCFRHTAYYRLQHNMWQCVHCSESYYWSDLLISVERL